jgi:hypothetical protein
MRDVVTGLSKPYLGADDNAYAVPPEPSVAPRTQRTADAAGAAGGPPPLYWRMLRLRHVRPSGWQRALLVEGVLAVAVTLVLADVASAWTLLVLPLATAAVVKGHDILTGWLPGHDEKPALPPATVRDYLPLAAVTVVLIVLALVR